MPITYILWNVFWAFKISFMYYLEISLYFHNYVLLLLILTIYQRTVPGPLKEYFSNISPLILKDCGCHFAVLLIRLDGHMFYNSLYLYFTWLLFHCDLLMRSKCAGECLHCCLWIQFFPFTNGVLLETETRLLKLTSFNPGEGWNTLHSFLSAIFCQDFCLCSWFSFLPSLLQT